MFFKYNFVVESLQSQFALYKDNFPVLAHQTGCMLQFIILSSFEIEDFVATPQNYTELIEDKAKEQRSISNNWKPVVQMPFGKPIAKPDEKQFHTIEDRVKIYN